MRYLVSSLIAAFLLTVGGMSVFAQDEKNKAEVFLGYSHARMDTGFEDDDDFDIDGLSDSVGAHGFEGAVTGNFHKYVGVKFDVSHHRKSENFDISTTDRFNAKFTLTQFLGGLQFKNNKKEGSRVRPFMHVLGGLARHKLSGDGTFFETDGKGGGTTTAFDFSESTNSFAMAIGGGIDVRAGKRVDIRIFQADWNPIWLGERTIEDFELDGRRLNNFRFGFGIVIH